MCFCALIGINIAMCPGIVQSNYGVTLVGGGELNPASVTDSLTIAPCLVAADGGADAVLALGLTPQAVIGDMDSISHAALAATEPGRIHRITEQDTTDFEKCLMAIRAPFILAAGFTGARMDHGLAAFHALVRHPAQRCIILGTQDICFLAPALLVLDIPKATRLSLFPMGAVSGRSTGLRWPINGLAFAPDRKIGTSNETTGPVRLSFDAAAMLVILPTPCLPAAIAALLRDAPPPPARGK